MKQLPTRNIAIIGYTRTGITRRMCGILANELLPVRSHYVEPQKNYIGAAGFLRGLLDVMKKREPAVYPPKPDIDLSLYDLVIVAGPVWGGSIATPLGCFLAQYGQGAKRTALLVTHSRNDPCPQVLDQLDGILGVKRSFALSVCSIEADAMEAAVEGFAAELLRALTNN
jgi:hypothetical protein